MMALILSGLFISLTHTQTDGVKIGIVCDILPAHYTSRCCFASAGAMNIALDRLIKEEIISNETIEA